MFYAVLPNSVHFYWNACWLSIFGRKKVYNWLTSEQVSEVNKRKCSVLIPSDIEFGAHVTICDCSGLLIVLMSRFIETWLVELSVLSMLLLTIVVYSDVKWCWGRVDNPSGRISYWGHRNVRNLGGLQGIWSLWYVQKNPLSASIPITPYGQC